MLDSFFNWLFAIACVGAMFLTAAVLTVVVHLAYVSQHGLAIAAVAFFCLLVYLVHAHLD